MNRAVLYLRVSTVDQNLDTQRLDLEQLATQRKLEIVATYSDKLSGAKDRRPGLDTLLADARRGKFDVVLIWGFDRLGRSTRHLLEVLDELRRLNVEFITFRGSIDTTGPLGQAFVTISAAFAEFERSLIVERVRAGMRRAKLEGRKMGRPKKIIDVEALLADRTAGMSLQQLAKAHHVSKATIGRLLRENGAVSKSPSNPPPQPVESVEAASAT